MRRFVSILLFASLLACAFAYSSLLPQRALAASTTLSVQTVVLSTDVANKPVSSKRWGYGYHDGYHDGYRDGYDEGITACYDSYRHRDGWSDEGDWSYRRGYHDGYRDGFDAGKHDCYDHSNEGASHDFHHGHHGDRHDNHGDKSSSHKH